MKNNISTKLILLILAALIITNGATYIIAKNKNQGIAANVNNNLQHKFFENDIFAEMDDIEKQMNKSFEEHRKLVSKMFQDNRGTTTSSGSNFIGFYEDQQFYRYELTFGSFKKEDVDIKVNGRILTIFAKNEQSSSDKKKGESHLSNNFYYSVSIPSDASNDPEIIREDKKVTIKFKKIISSKKSAEDKKEK